MVSESDTRARQAEDVRDLRRQIVGIEKEDQQEIIFKEVSPERRKVIVYSMTTGEPVSIPANALVNVLAKMDRGKPRFTGYKERAPEHKLGTTKCFLHADSPEHDVLLELGIDQDCPAGNLKNVNQKRMHALHKHREEWASYQAYLGDEKEKAAIARTDRQLEATLMLARQASGQAVESADPERPAAEKGVCDICGQGGYKNLSAHKRGAHPGG